PHSSPLFPYTTLFRSHGAAAHQWSHHTTATRRGRSHQRHHHLRELGLVQTAHQPSLMRNADEPRLLADNQHHRVRLHGEPQRGADRKSTRLNSSHLVI